MKMKKQNLTPEQYQRTNKTLFFVLMVCYVIFLAVEITNWSNGVSNAVSALARSGLYVAVIVMDGIVVKMFGKKKCAAVTMALAFLAAYGVLVFGNGAATVVMAFPVIIGFMIYLNTPLVVIGCVAAFIICALKCAILKAGGDMTGYAFANVATMGMLVSIVGSWRAISLLIDFSKEDQEVIKKEAAHREEIAKTVVEITEKVDADFRGVLTELQQIREDMGTAHVSMEDMAKSSESTAEAANRQADMTGQIQDRLEKANGTASEAEAITENLKKVIGMGKQNADDLYAQSVLVDQNTAHISDTVNQLVDNVQQVSNITETIMSISSQTNMLALNASIEAARAGELGKGFAVVADQIRNLAEQTKVSTEQITEIIAQLNAVTNETREGLQESVESITVQRKKVEEVTANFADVESGMENLADGIEHMGHQVRRVLVANKEIVESISTLSAASEEVLAGTQLSKENIDSTYNSLNNFSKTVEETFSQLQNLKEAAEAK